MYRSSFIYVKVIGDYFIRSLMIQHILHPKNKPLIDFHIFQPSIAIGINGVIHTQVIIPQKNSKNKACIAGLRKVVSVSFAKVTLNP